MISRSCGVSRSRIPDFAPSSETPGGYVGQAVVEKRGTFMWWRFTQRLEGSQTSPCRLKLQEATSGRPLWDASRRPREFRLKTNPAGPCESRRLPGITARDVSSQGAAWGSLIRSTRL
jgi:hypothetical protein